MRAANKPEILETEEELLTMKRSEVIRYLTDKQIAFCEEYTKSNNISHAAKVAGLSTRSAHVQAWKIRQNPECARYIAWLKSRVVNECQVKAAELVDQYLKIAFADITDFLEMDQRKQIKIKSLDQIDGQVVSKIQQRPSGFTIELHDKMKALEKIEQYFDIMPLDWKQKIEERKLQLLEERLDLEKKKAGLYEGDMEDDGFLEALQSVAEEVWDDTEIVEE